MAAESEPEPVVLPSPAVEPIPRGQLSDDDIDRVFDLADVPAEWRAALKSIAFCESRYNATAVGDSGASLGLFQLWSGWFSWAGYGVGEWSDPVINTRVAMAVRNYRGRFGGAGGWSCADALSIR